MKLESSLKKLSAGVLSEMERMNYAKRTISYNSRFISDYSKFVVSLGQNDKFSETLAKKFLKERYNYPSKEVCSPLPLTIASAVRIMRLLGEIRAYGAFVKKPNRINIDWAMNDIQIINSYVEAMQTRNNSEATKKSRTHHIKLFYNFLGFQKIDKIQDITPQTISLYVLSLQGSSPVYSKHKLATLRNYFRFLYANGYCSKDFSHDVPVIRLAKNMNVSALWSKEEVEMLLKSVDRGSPGGKRDYAIILLVAQYGIRITDIANLKLENLKWERRQIEFCQHKTGVAVSFQMTEEVGWALINYLQKGRPNIDSPFLFITRQAPYKPLLSGAQAIIFHYMTKCGIKRKSGTRRGMHSLRHALGRQLLEKEVPLEIISQIMGHVTVESASPYLKVDIEGLRDCALSIAKEIFHD